MHDLISCSICLSNCLTNLSNYLIAQGRVPNTSRQCRQPPVVSRNYNPKYLLITLEMSRRRFPVFRYNKFYTIFFVKYLNIKKSPKQLSKMAGNASSEGLNFKTPR